MPHQEHLPQAGGELAHRSGVRGTAPRPAGLSGRWPALLLLALAGLAALLACPAAAGEPIALDQAQAVRGGWHDEAPPDHGWEPVRLPDNWATRWPEHDGVVWYRFRWRRPAGEAPVALMLPWINMAGSVYVNGIELHRDASLVEPLTRSWNTPMQWLVDPALLREGDNTVLVRVAGMAAYQGGLPPLVAGDPAQVRARYNEEQLWRHDLPLIAMAASVVIVLLFGGLSLMRPRETAYAWFALMSLAWLLFEFNHLATSPWPLPDTDAWQALNTSALVFFAAAFLPFMLRLRARQAPLLEACAWIATAVALTDLWSMPRADAAAHRAAWSSVSAAGIAVAAVGVLAGHWRSTSVRSRVPLLLLLLVVLAADAHDLLVFLQWMPDTRYYGGIASCTLLVALAVLLARRFTRAMDDTAQFNARLIAQVEAAKAELRDTLERSHALKLMHARATERAALASDLHDGLGGMLVGSIASLEHAPRPVPQDRILAMLKDLRDDLRLILDATGPQPDLQPLDDVLAPLRHRLGPFFEANGIVCRWHLLNLGDLTLNTSLNIGVLRFLQEALTNALKHSGAARVDVYVTRTRTHLRLDVRDDGRGFAVGSADAAPGNGLRNMRTRAQRLGGVVQWQSQPGRTVVTLLIDLVSPR